MLPGRPISGGSVLYGQVQDAEKALALHFRMKIFFTWQQGLDIVVTLGHNLGNDLAGFVSGVGYQVFHGISGF
jgi:hypothetical protein